MREKILPHEKANLSVEKVNFAVILVGHRRKLPSKSSLSLSINLEVQSVFITEKEVISWRFAISPNAVKLFQYVDSVVKYVPLEGDKQHIPFY